ncbi:unnamed protein product [Brachionus calyciflorus]|uniref:Reverse transcriptase domain-containing protein n=1 Tax=Brachionus calyciflorus TaxID=104777 RepID=A0A813QAS5_9BILA|nr:unnamed protein product [Brachionus calyciflorus]
MQRPKESVDISLDELKLHYQNVFTKRNKKDTFSDIIDEKFVKEYTYKYQNVVFDYQINTENITKLFEKLPNNKTIGINDVSNEMLKYSNNKKLKEHLKNVFEIIINRQVIPYIFNTSIIKPILKDSKKSGSDIDNISPIAISDCLSNLFEAILLDILNKEHHDHQKQFGFKKNSSCQHAMWTLKQAIEISKRTKRCTYVCSLDASKAFDKVNRTILWKQLIKNKISPYVILSLINYYNDSFLLVNNNNSYSMSFKSTNGVKQGGKCSPKLFSIYLEPLLEIISQTESGIIIDKIKIDIIAYADDPLLVSSTKSSLQKCLDLVTKFGEDFEIQFNLIKTHYIVFDFSQKKSTMKDNLYLNLSGLNIERVDTIKYLGMQLNEKYDDRINIKKRIKCSYVALAKLRNLEILTEKTDA